MHSDRNNPTISSLEGFEAPLAEYKPDLLVVSGLQMMDNYPFAEGEREARLKKVFFLAFFLKIVNIETNFRSFRP